MTRTSRLSFVSIASIAGISASLSMLAPMAAKAFTAGEVSPAYTPTYVTSNTTDESQARLNSPDGNSPASFAFYFDTTKGPAKINALGFSEFPSWAGGNDGGTSYDVKLYGWVDPVNPVYTTLATATFNKSDVSTYVSSGGYYWIPLSNPVSLEWSVKDSYEGYVVSAIGCFGATSGTGTCPNPGLPYIYGGTGVVQRVEYSGNGLNYSGSGFYSSFPDPIAFDPAVTNGYFNANFSYAPVPGPLPLMGAGVAFGWSRRLRRRLNA